MLGTLYYLEELKYKADKAPSVGLSTHHQDADRSPFES